MHYLFLFVFSLVALPAFAAPPSTSLTIYSKAAPGAVSPELYLLGANGMVPSEQVPGYAVVRNEREINLPEKNNVVTFSDVAAHIDPTTVVFSSLTDPKGTHVIDQNYLFDLAGSDKILERYLGHVIQVEQARGDKTEIYTGKLLSTQGGLILQEEDGKLETITQYNTIRFPSLPQGLMIKPTLLWNVTAEKPGKHTARVSYQTSGITWWADYNIVFTEGKEAGEALLDMGAWVSIINQSGASYNDALLKLMAGDVHRVQAPTPRLLKGRAMMAEAERPVPDFEEKSFFEYHLYTLNHPVTLPDKSTKQLELFPAIRHIPAQPVYEFDGQIGNTITTRLTFKNSTQYGLGIPLPAGRVRVNKQNPKDGAFEFVGEDIIGHTPKDEEVTLTLGNSFDITGKREVVAEQTNNEQKWAEEEVLVTLYNHKKTPVTVNVKENLHRSPNWHISKESHPYKQKNAQLVQFPVALPADKQVKLSYFVRYTW